MEVLTTMFSHGGAATWMIFIAGLILVAVGSERLITLYYRLSFNAESSVEVIRGHILNKKYIEAIQVCNSNETVPDLSVVKAALLAVENGREAMKSALGASLLSVNHKCEARIQYLALIANVATLLGLFGTITGLIKTFAAMANADASEKAKLLGIGISEAMYATAAGLAVGIAAMVIHTICLSKADSIVGQAQDVGYKVITWVEQSERMKQNG